MPNKELHDYLTSATLNFSSSALTLSPQDIIDETGSKNQFVKYGDDGSEEIISYSNSPIFYVTLRWPVLRSTEAGIIMDYWASSNKGNGKARTFKLNYGDGHTYVARFDSDISRTMRPGPYSLGIHAIPSARFRILGTT